MNSINKDLSLHTQYEFLTLNKYQLHLPNQIYVKIPARLKAKIYQENTNMSSQNLKLKSYIKTERSNTASF